MTGERFAHVAVRYTKWDGTPHWRCDTIRTAEDEYGTWLYSPAGTLLERPGHSFATQAPSITLIDPALPWTPTWWDLARAPEHLRVAVYVDMTTAPVWHGRDEVGMVDLDLDVVQLRDGTVELVDEDEFEEHRAGMGYPDEIVELARRGARDVLDLLGRAEEPYRSIGMRRLTGATRMLNSS